MIYGLIALVITCIILGVASYITDLRRKLAQAKASAEQFYKRSGSWSECAVERLEQIERLEDELTKAKSQLKRARARKKAA